ncbi:MAG: SUMF1/EgtB/PvdO family nonheme iron enzyme [Saprospiraceae bacterium]
MKQAPDIFIAYSHNDLRFKDELKKFLRPLLNTKRASLWDDHDIEAGKEWEAEIKKRLYGAEIILLLVSPDSLASDYFYGREVTVSLERHEKGEAVVVPVILRPCAWTITPLAKLEALPAKGKPVTQWPSQDEAFTDIAHSIGEIVAKLAETRHKTAAEALQRQEFLAAVQAAEHLWDKNNWLEAARAYEAAARLHRPGFLPEAAALHTRIAECDLRQKQQSETLATIERRTAYERTLTRARELQQATRWSEACAAWQQALNQYEPGFPESPATLQRQLDECTATLQREADFQRKLTEAEKHLERRAWTKAVAAAQAALQLQPGNEAANKVLDRANAELASVDNTFKIGIGARQFMAAGGGLMLIIFLIWKIIPSGTRDENPSPEGETGHLEVSDNFILIPGGTFQMGDLFDEGDSDEKPVRNVTLSDFYLSKFELTLGEFRQFISATKYETDADKGGWSYIWNGSNWEKKDGVNWKCDIAGKLRPEAENNHPVIHVSWYDAVAYCNWLSGQRGLQKVYSISGTNVAANWNANGYRLPTEAEWEYAARQGGKKVRFGNGQNTAEPKAINFDGSAGGKKDYSVVGEYRAKTLPVGSLNSPNALGLHDMSGNVWEWCWDWYGTYPSTAETNPKGPDSGSDRVIRGGSWGSDPAYVRCANRGSDSPGSRYYYLGFRLARAVR